MMMVATDPTPPQSSRSIPHEIMNVVYDGLLWGGVGKNPRPKSKTPGLSKAVNQSEEGANVPSLRNEEGHTLYNARVDGANVVTIAYLDDAGDPRGKIGVCVNELETFVKNFAKNSGRVGDCSLGWELVVGVRPEDITAVDRVEKFALPPELRIVVGGKGSYRLCRSIYRYRLKPTIGRFPWSIDHKSALGIRTANEPGPPGRVVTYSEKTPFVMLRTTSAISRLFAPDVFRPVGHGGEAEREPTGGNPKMEELCAGLGSDKRSQTPAYHEGLEAKEWGACVWRSEDGGQMLPAWFLNWVIGSLFVGYFMGDGSASERDFRIRATEYDEVWLVAEALFTIFECDGMEIYIERVAMDTTVGVDLELVLDRSSPPDSLARSLVRQDRECAIVDAHTRKVQWEIVVQFVDDDDDDDADVPAEDAGQGASGSASGSANASGSASGSANANASGSGSASGRANANASGSASGSDTTSTVGGKMLQGDDVLRRLLLDAGLTSQKLTSVDGSRDRSRPGEWERGWWLPPDMRPLGKKGKRTALARLLRTMTYDGSGYRIFPIEYLNSGSDVLHALWQGLWLADGSVFAVVQRMHAPPDSHAHHAGSLLIPSGTRMNFVVPASVSADSFRHITSSSCCSTSARAASALSRGGTTRARRSEGSTTARICS